MTCAYCQPRPADVMAPLGICSACLPAILEKLVERRLREEAEGADVQ